MSTRGGPPRGRGRERGNSATTASRGAFISRGRGSGGQRSNAPVRMASTQASRGNAIRGRGSHVAKHNDQSNGVAAARGSWQERYQELTKAREIEREQAIANGILAHPDKRRTLAEAVTPVGTCMDMCPEYERAERVVQRDIWAEERDLNRSVYGAADQEPDESRMVKKFHRPDAGAQEQLPSDLRPPIVLKRTIEFLFDDVLANATSLGKVHGFIWDRTRGIRNDFSIQQVTKPEDVQIAIDCYERIVRFHILSLHQLSVDPPISDKFSPFQEREQLDATLLSLMSFYDENRSRISLPNEGEFRAYFILFHLQDPDVEDRAQSWPSSVLCDTKVQEALCLYAAACNIVDRHGPLSPFATQAIAQQDWQKFWTLVGSKRVSYLMGCTAEIYFNLIRRTVLNAIWRGYRARIKVSPESFTVEYLTELLCLDSDEEVLRFCELYGFTFKRTTHGSQCLDLTSVPGTSLTLPKGDVKQMKSDLVEEKRFGRTLPSIINGMTVKQAQDAGLTLVEEMEETMDDVIDENVDTSSPRTGDEAVNEPEDDGESLFIPENKQPNSSTVARAVNPFAPTTDVLQEQASNRSPFAGFSGFGKPSNGFGTPMNNTSDTVSSGIFSASSKPTEFDTSGAKTTKFNFTNATTGGETKLHESSSALQPASFSFSKPSNLTVNDVSESVAPAAPPAEEKSTTNHESIFSMKSPISTTPFFDWNATKSQEPSHGSNDTVPIKTTPSFAFPVTTTPQSQAPERIASNSFTFGHVTKSTTDPASASETKPTQSQITTPAPATSSPSAPLHISQHAPTEQSSRRASLANFQPRKPSPLSHSFGPEEHEHRLGVASTSNDQIAGALEQVKPIPVPAPIPVPTKSISVSKSDEAAERTKILSGLATDLFLQPDGGYLQQFVEYTVEKVITEVQEKIYFERINNEADTFRWNVLATRYSRRWRDLAWRRRLANKGRARRQRAQRALRESKTPSEMGSVLSSVTASVVGSCGRDSTTRRQEVDAMFQKTIPNGTTSDVKALLAGKSSEKDRNLQSSHKRLKDTSHVGLDGRVIKLASSSDSQNDLLKRSSFLGFSLNRQSLRRGSTTKTNYFKLKALGIAPEPVPAMPRGTKRHREESIDSASCIRSQNKKPSPSGPQQDIALQPPVFAPRTSSAADDDALFTRLNAARKKLQESAAFMKSEVVKDQELRNAAFAHSTYESPSMARARAEARWRASQDSAMTDALGGGADVPAYRLRESKFVPREHYAKAIERSRDFRKSRSREVSRPVSRNAADALSIASPVLDHQHSVSLFQQQNQVDTGPSGVNNIHSLKPNGLAEDLQMHNQVSSFSQYKPPDGLPVGSKTAFSTSTAAATDTGPEYTFGQPNSFSSFPQSSFQSSEQVSYEGLNFTIKPSQVNQSLSRSFGPGSNFDSQASFYQTVQHHQGDSATLQQENSFLQQSPWTFGQAEESTAATVPNSSYLHSEAAPQAAAAEAMSLLCDEEREVQQPNLYHPAEVDREKLLDDNTEEYSVSDDMEEVERTTHSYRHLNHTNPFAALAGDDDEQSEDEDEKQKSYGDDDDEEEEDEDEEQVAQINGHESDSDGDLEDGYEEGEEEDELDYSEEESAEEAESEGKTRRYAQPSHGFLAQSYETSAYSPKNDTLQAVGNTQEEAIELSD